MKVKTRYKILKVKYTEELLIIFLKDFQKNTNILRNMTN
jgi:hypothetical protein